MSATTTEPVTQEGQDGASGFPTSDEDVKPEGDGEAQARGSLFDDSQYQTEELALPKVDGEGIDKLQAIFGGSPFLDRADARDVALIRDTRMNHTITLIVEARVGPPVPRYSTNRQGDLDSLCLTRKLTVEKVWRASPETASALLAEVGEAKADGE